MLLRFAYFDVLYLLLPLLIMAILYRWKFYKTPIYRYSLGKELAEAGLTKRSYHKIIFFLLRLATLTGLIFLIMRPQWVDQRSKVNVDGVDIVLAIDVSESMTLFDDIRDQRSRLTVAKDEAVRFVDKRTDDPIGIVVFGREALSRCPLTVDKQILKEIISTVDIGMINPQGTWLGTGLATAINRLKGSKAKSKIIILLTDGSPTPSEKVDPEMAMDLAQKFGIKVYTIGIGNKNGGFFNHPFLGIVPAETSLNEALLKTIAEKTGGQYFRASSPKDMGLIYDTIDKLERTKIQTNFFHRYYEAFLTFIWIILLLLGLEMLLKLFLWRGV